MASVQAREADGRAAIERIAVRDSFGFMARLTYLGLRGVLHGELARRRLTSGIWYYLWALWEADGINQKELSERVHIKEASTTVTLRTMERAGLIRRERDTGDKRSVRIYLTAAGRALEGELSPCAVKGNLIALAGFSPDEVVQVHSYMRRVVDNLQRHDVGCSA